jgi:peptidoglycan hydrolase-like protein with peptidoglycan-binding domain
MTIYTRRVLPKAAQTVRNSLERLNERVRTDGPLVDGDTGGAVKTVEAHLKSAGLFSGTPDGTFDAKTRRAVMALQKAKHLDPTGEVNWKTFQAVRSLNVFVSKGFKKPAEEGQRGSDILKAEKQLHKLGYKRAKPDGLFTHNTTIAVKKLQRQYGLKATGDINASTAAKLKQLNTTKRTHGYINGVARNITVTPVGNGEYMRTDAARAFLKMQASAKRAGISLSATSGFRTMAEQKHLYALWQAGQGNLAARPGFSNHQGGIAMDVGGVNGYHTSAYNWLSRNAKRFGFVNDVGGEYWHWTYKR